MCPFHGVISIFFCLFFWVNSELFFILISFISMLLMIFRGWNQAGFNFLQYCLYLHSLLVILVFWICAIVHWLICSSRKFSLIKLQFLLNVLQMLTQTAASLAYESTRSYIENHLEYLLECWIENNFSVDDFQFQLLDFNSQAAFYQLVFLFAYCFFAFV